MQLEEVWLPHNKVEEMELQDYRVSEAVLRKTHRMEQVVITQFHLVGAWVDNHLVSHGLVLSLNDG